VLPDEVGDELVAGDDGGLEGGLVGEVAGVARAAAQEEDAGAAVRVVGGAEVEGRVARVVGGVEVGAVVEEVVEVVGEAELAGVVDLVPVVGVARHAHARAVEEQVLEGLHTAGVQDGVVEGREHAAVAHLSHVSEKSIIIWPISVLSYLIGISFGHILLVFCFFFILFNFDI